MNMVYVRMGNSPGTSGAVPVSFNDTIWQKLNDVFCNLNSVSSIKDANQLKIFPDPAQNYFTISFAGKLYDFVITDMTGSIFFKKKSIFAKTEIDCSGFGNGVYYVQATDGKNIYNEKIIITR